ncbi:O-antigen ligase family protein [Flavobacterium sp.]|uniref:O-antigen ligase family protein n=1 Tax=Flavobacterium sp. TaxID=239 RepID=UPI0031DD4462
MKIQQLFIFLALLLLSLLVRLNLDNLLFLHGKYIYWLFVIVMGSAFFLFQNHNIEWKLNLFDLCIIILLLGGLWNFISLSDVKVFNFKVWYFIGYLLLYIILRRSLYTKEKILEISKKIYCLLFLLALLNSVIAILQKNNLLSSSNEYFQVTGLFFSPNHLALFLVIGILSLIVFSKENKSHINKVLFFICLIILSYGLYLTECRGAYVALIVGMVFNLNTLNQEIKEFSFFKKLLFVSIILSCFFTLIWNTSAPKSESISGRLFIIKHSLSQLEYQLLTGFGFDSFSLQYNLAKADYFSIERSWDEIRNAAYLYNANNDFLELVFEMGIIWTAVFYVFIIMLFVKANNSKTTKSCRSMLLCIIIFTFTNTIIPIPLFIVIGCVLSVFVINQIEMKPILIFTQNSFFTGIAIIFLVIFSTIITLRLNAEYNLKRIYNGEEIAELKKIENYVSKIDANGEQFFMAGIILLKNNNYKEGINYLKNGFEKSGKPSLGQNLARLFERMDMYFEAEKIYIYNKNVEPYRFDARMDLFNLYLKTNQKEKAIKIAKEILCLPVKIPSERIKLFKEKAKMYLENEQKKQCNLHCFFLFRIHSINQISNY